MKLFGRVLLLALILAATLSAQEVAPTEQSQRSPPGLPPSSLPSEQASAVLKKAEVQSSLSSSTLSEPLPDAPSVTLSNLLHDPAESDPADQNPAQPAPLKPCPPAHRRAAATIADEPASQSPSAPCQKLNPYRAFLNNATAIPLLPRQKAYLAVHDVVDPFNLLTIALNSAFTVSINAHNPYDPGLRGFAWDSLYTLSQDATGEFIGTFAVCSLLHEDPHYHRLSEGSPKQRFLHAISRTWVAQRDDGRMMPNYEKFITYPASAELSNLYVPGVAGNGPSTVERIVIGLASDPIDNLITEFLPDFASRIHVHVVFVQQLINQVAAGQI